MSGEHELETSHTRSQWHVPIEQSTQRQRAILSRAAAVKRGAISLRASASFRLGLEVHLFIQTRFHPGADIVDADRLGHYPNQVKVVPVLACDVDTLLELVGPQDQEVFKEELGQKEEADIVDLSDFRSLLLDVRQNRSEEGWDMISLVTGPRCLCRLSHRDRTYY